MGPAFGSAAAGVAAAAAAGAAAVAVPEAESRRAPQLEELVLQDADSRRLSAVSDRRKGGAPAGY